VDYRSTNAGGRRLDRRAYLGQGGWPTCANNHRSEGEATHRIQVGGRKAHEGKRTGLGSKENHIDRGSKGRRRNAAAFLEGLTDRHRARASEDRI